MFEGYLSVESRDEKALMEAVYKHGPIAVAVDASPDGFSFYKVRREWKVWGCAR